ncbi:MAG: type II toxin-antitoxin system prevent-host-death family antitoxin [Luteitalea sp.]|nr:type II toxin-antitoxin system prevent-host-death family antitoxin [Luteitalea sp.]
MITVNMHEAKTRLSELVKAVEEGNEVVVLCRDGREVAEIRRRATRRPVRDLRPDPRFRVEYAAGYDQTEPLSDDEWRVRKLRSSACAPRSHPTRTNPPRTVATHRVMHPSAAVG